MKQWIFEMILNYLVKELTEDKLKEWAKGIKVWAIPYIKAYKSDFITRLRVEAAKTETQIDDAVVTSLDEFLECFMPDNTKCL